ncbi:IclR family transcriptional regulator (plasmid) [Halobaculum sp. CBA1158]|uniref:IclR family transcriptional regulator n=1 Tax=Halobaculum sp. CBA1158 TaxID=2904243 RepID=UPI001F187571|nr:IclR family transcriptional regulator [Halobaculum sp. CBA1158]UIP01487.1 IclR family transcriptional regulator [Halobaculum sp. CBA1158]
MERDTDGTRGVKSDETLFALVEQIRESEGAGVTELADALGLAKSTVHGHLSTMREHGFVVRRDGEYRLGLEFFGHGQYVRTQRAVYDVALPVLDDLAEETGETTWLMVHENGRVMVIDGRAAGAEINVNSVVGSWAHMHANSGGKAILAHLPTEEVDEIAADSGLPAMTDATITDREALATELETVRERGFALNLGEDLRGIHAVAVPLFDGDEVQGSIAIAGPAHRVDRDRCTGELAERLGAAADDIEVGLAYR